MSIKISKKKSINELNLDGYKEIANTKWEFPDDLVGYLKYHNFEMIGQGDLSWVFQSPTENFVVKVNRGKVEKEYSKFIDCSRANRSNPHFPKFGRMRMIEHEGYKFYVLFIEKLSIGTENPGFNINYACEFISDAWQAMKFNKYETEEQLKHLYQSMKSRDLEYDDGMMFKSKYSDQYFDLIKTLFVMSDYISADYLDIHPGNVGFRGDTLVILDPVRAVEE